VIGYDALRELIIKTIDDYVMEVGDLADNIALSVSRANGAP
jgi:hypothetical protein